MPDLRGTSAGQRGIGRPRPAIVRAATTPGESDGESDRRRGIVAVFRDERSEEYPRYSKRVIDSIKVTGIEQGLGFTELAYALDPDWAELLGLYVRGGMYAREVVPQSTREICACAALAVTNQQEQLRSHLVNGHTLGATKEELLEAILQSVTYGGFPSTVSAIKTYAEVFPDMVKRDRPAIPASSGEPPSGRDPLAVETVNKLYGEEYGAAIFERYDRWDPSFSILAQRFVFGGTYARTVVSAGMRELIAIACLTVRNALPQLETHVRVGFRLGLKRAEMQEIILQMTVYCGYPYVMQAMAAFERVAAEAERDE
jgi:4-carboxymuconolactone decarboxylase